MAPRQRGAIALLALLLSFLAPNLFAQAPPLSYDYQRIMEWLSKETANGLAFNAGSTFDPPNEIAPFLIQPDFSLGIGFVPFRKERFPDVQQSLKDVNVQNNFPSSILFPNLSAHVRMGLPDRWDVSVRFADMTIPKGYKLTPGTKGDGQSNTLGVSVRKHFLGGDDPLLSVSLNLNHVFGHFNLQSSFKDLQYAPGFFADTDNKARLDWNVTSVGSNFVVSQNYDSWTPFAGLGLNAASGSVSASLASTSATPFFSPAYGSASSKPDTVNGRFIFGAQKDWERCGLFLNGEIKTIGSESFKTFIVSIGLARPFSFGVGAEDRSTAPRRERRLAWPERSDSTDRYDRSGGNREQLRDAPASIPVRSEPSRAQPLELIFIQ